YRLVPGRVALERLIGEALLGRLRLADDPSMSTVEHLVDFAMRLRHFTLANPGTAAYAQHSFPRGPSGVTAMATEVTALTSRGYSPGAAIGLCGAVASLALGLLAAEDARLSRAANLDEAAQEAANASAAVLDDPVLRTAHFDTPALDAEEFFHLVISASVRGLIESLPPGRPLDGLVDTTRRGLARQPLPDKETEY
ncbi:MAG: TetR/AcrR family transcriptional regulator, partial [Stackebrandtia sp.]